VHNLLPSILISKIVNIKRYRNFLLLVVFFGCATWSLPLREERRLGVLENTVLRRIFGPKGDKVTGKWRNRIMRSLLICIPGQILFGLSNREEWDGRACNSYGVRSCAYEVLVAKPERKRLLGRPRREWEDTNKMVLQEVGWRHILDWSGSG